MPVSCPIVSRQHRSLMAVAMLPGQHQFWTRVTMSSSCAHTPAGQVTSAPRVSPPPGTRADPACSSHSDDLSAQEQAPPQGPFPSLWPRGEEGQRGARKGRAGHRGSARGW